MVHIIGRDWREKIRADILWSDIVSIGVWLISSPDIVLSGEDTIDSCLDMRPSVPVSIFTIRISGSRTLCFEYSSYRSPATGYIVLESEVVFTTIACFRCDSDTYSVEFSFGKHPTDHRNC